MTEIDVYKKKAESDVCVKCGKDGVLLPCTDCSRTWHWNCAEITGVPESGFRCSYCSSSTTQSLGEPEAENVCRYCSRRYAISVLESKGQNGANGSTLWRCFACEEIHGVDKIISRKGNWFLVTWNWSGHWHASWLSRERLMKISIIKLRNFEKRYAADLAAIETNQDTQHQHDSAPKKPGADTTDTQKNPATESESDAEAGNLDADREQEEEEEEEDNTGFSSNDPTWNEADRKRLAELRGYHLTFTKVHRVLDIVGNRYLVKWQSRPYSECTWELGDDLMNQADGREAMRVFRARRDAQSDDVMETNDPEYVFTSYLTQPEWLIGGQLHGYQLEGVNWLRSKYYEASNVILADEMGLGKTIMTTGLLASVVRERPSQLSTARSRQRQPSLVVAPLSTIDNWEREASKWCPWLNVVVLVGNQIAREVIKKYEINKAAHFDILVTSYEMASLERSLLQSYDFAVIVVDEGHRLKSGERSKLFKDLIKMKTNQRVLLTGTPLQNSVNELYHLIQFLDPKLYHELVDADADEKARNNADRSDTNTTEILVSDDNGGSKAVVDRLRQALAGRMLRRTKQDVLGSEYIPSKHEQIVQVELSGHQKTLYRAVLTRNYAALACCDEDTTNAQGGTSDDQPSSKRRRALRNLDPSTGARASNSAPILQNIVMQLRKVCNHTKLMEPLMDAAILPGPNSLDNMLAGSGKLALLDQMLQRWKVQGHRVLLFSQMTKMLDVLADYLQFRGYNFSRLDGATKHRQAIVDEFNDPKSSSFVFLLSTRAGGLGINLATADTVVIYDADWNPHNDLQALARAHRIGQRNKVMVYRLVSRDSVEERILHVAKKKLCLEHVVVGANGRHKATISKSELDDVLRYGAQELFAKSKDSDAIIHWDDEALEKLLDRTSENTEDSAMDTSADKDGVLTPKNGLAKLMDSFKVAETSFRQKPLPVVEAAPVEDKASMDVDAETEVSDANGKRKRDGAHLEAEEEMNKFQWSELLQESHQEKINEEEAVLSRGRRSAYRVQKVVTSSSPSLAQIQDSGIALTHGITKSYIGTLERGQTAKLKLMASRVFLHGLVFAESGRWEWTRTVLRIGEDADETRKIGLALLELILKNSDRGDLVFGYEPQKLLVRIGFFALAERVLATGIELRRNADDFSMTWTHDHDRRLLTALCCCGYGKWERILNGDRFELWPALQASLDIQRQRRRMNAIVKRQAELTGQRIPNTEVYTFLKARVKKIQAILLTINCDAQLPNRLLSVSSKTMVRLPTMSQMENKMQALDKFIKNADNYRDLVMQQSVAPSLHSITTVHKSVQALCQHIDEIKRICHDANTRQIASGHALENFITDKVFVEEMKILENHVAKLEHLPALISTRVANADNALKTMRHTMTEVLNMFSTDKALWSAENITNTKRALHLSHMSLEKTKIAGEAVLEARRALQDQALVSVFGHDINTVEGISIADQENYSTKWVTCAWRNKDNLIRERSTIVSDAFACFDDCIKAASQRADTSAPSRVSELRQADDDIMSSSVPYRRSSETTAKHGRPIENYGDDANHSLRYAFRAESVDTLNAGHVPPPTSRDYIQ